MSEEQCTICGGYDCAHLRWVRGGKPTMTTEQANGAVNEMMSGPRPKEERLSHPEVRAIDKCVKALKPLDPEAAQRVLRYVSTMLAHDHSRKHGR